MQLTDELRVVVAAEVDKAIRDFERLNTGIGKSESRAKKLSDALDRMGRGAAVVSAAAAAAGVAAVKFAGNLEQTQLALEVLLGDAEQATRIKNEWTALAAETPFSSSDIDSAGKKLLAFNISAEEVTETLRRIGDISAATGSSISEIADIYGKAAVQGRLFAEDINQFQGRGIPVVQALAEVLGVAETDIRDLVSEGKIGFPELEAAFRAMTDEGGQFSGMMEKLSTSTLGRFSSVMDNAELAIASFGSVMLDTVNDVLDAGDDFFQWLQDVDDGTKRFIITFSGVSAGVAGALVAIKSLAGAFAALAANPLVLGAVAAAAGIGLIVAAVNKANHRLEDAASEIAKTNQKQKELLDSFANGDAAKKLDAKTTKKLIELYPELSGEIKAYSTSVEEASEAVKKLNREKIAESAEGDLRKLRRMLAEVGETEQYAAQKADEYLKHMTDLSIAAANGGIKESQIPDLSQIEKRNRDSARERLKKAKADYEAYFAELDAYLKTAGMTLTDDLRIIDIPDVTVTEGETDTSAVTESINRSLGTQTEDVRKTWQQWFREVTGVEGAFRTGEEAGRLYAEGLADGAANKAALSDLLGFDTRASEEIRAQMQKVADDIGKLLAVPAEKIDEKFSLADASVQALAQEYRRLAAAAEEAEKAESVAATIGDLEARVAELGKSEAELTLRTLEANGATEEQTERARELLAMLEDVRKTWQQWFREVTGVEGAFRTGEEAGRLYAEGLADGAANKAALSDLLGFDTRASEEIRAQMQKVADDIGKLLAVPAEKIDEKFSLADASVQALAQEYRRLAAAAEEAEKAESVAATIGDLEARVAELGKSEAELTLRTLEANGATEEQTERARELLAMLEDAGENPLETWQERLHETIAAALGDLGDFAGGARLLIADIGTQLAGIAAEGLLEGISALGEALAQGADGAASMQEALADMARQILEQLPMLFLNAGLTMIANGNWAVGLGLIAAAGVSAFSGGVVEGLYGDDDDDEDENAKGGVYGPGGRMTFAKGGAFTNRIVTSPTEFRFARGGRFGHGLMGEAGPEAILPLRRMGDGSLGVASQGGGGGITVVINNYSQEAVSAKEGQGADGMRQLEVTIGAVINGHISSGKADKALGGRYGLRAKGV